MNTQTSSRHGPAPGSPVRAGSGADGIEQGAARRRILVLGWGNSRMARLVLKRVLTAIPTLWGATALTYLFIDLIPGNSAEAILGTGATPEQIRRLTSELKLNAPLYERYWHWLSGVLTGDLGQSYVNGQPVAEIIGRGIPVTLELGLLSFFVSLGIAVPVGVFAARRPEGIFDRVSMLLSSVGLSTAQYVLAVILVLIFAVKLGALPAIGWVPLSQSVGENLKFLILPVLSLALPFACLNSRVLRADLVDQVSSQEYVVAARAKGAPSWRVLLVHAFRNSLFGLITISGLNLGALFGQTVLVEQIFSLPGVGRQLLQAISTQDVPVVTDLVLLFSVTVVVANLLADLLYVTLDPRIRNE